MPVHLSELQHGSFPRLGLRVEGIRVPGFRGVGGARILGFRVPFSRFGF